MNYVFKATDPICERLGIGVSQEEILKEPCVDIKSKEDFFSENLFIESDGILELQKRLNILAQRRALDNCSTFDDEAKTTVDVLYTFAILQALKKLCTNCALILRMSLPIELAKVTELYAMFFELKEKESNFNIKKEIDMFKGHLSSFAKKVIDKIATLPINTLPVADKSYKQLQIINRICWGIHLDFSDKCNKKSQIDGAYMVGAYGVMAGVVMILSYKTYKLISSLFVNKNKDGQTKTLWESIKEKFSKKKALEV